MLVLTRKVGEQIKIGNEVVITVVRTKGKAVRLGVEAPAHVPVLRGELAAAFSGGAEQELADADDIDGQWHLAHDGIAADAGGLRKSTAVGSCVASAPLARLVASRSR